MSDILNQIVAVKHEEIAAAKKKRSLEAMREDAGVALSALKVDGGAVRNDFLMQLQADILGDCLGWDEMVKFGKCDVTR